MNAAVENGATLVIGRVEGPGGDRRLVHPTVGRTPPLLHPPVYLPFGIRPWGRLTVDDPTEGGGRISVLPVPFFLFFFDCDLKLP